jgi:hypothetical protein
VTPKSFALSNPARVVVDLAGATHNVRETSRTYDAGPVTRVRVSQFRSAPDPVVRVVADLRTAMPFQVETQDEDVVLVVGDSRIGASQATAAASAPVADPVQAAEPAPVSTSTSTSTSTDGSPEYVPFTPVVPQAQTVGDQAAVTPDATMTPSTPATEVVTSAWSAESTPAATPVPAAEVAAVATQFEDTSAPVSEPMEVAQQTPRGRRTTREPEAQPELEPEPEPVQPRPQAIIDDRVQLQPSRNSTRINLDVQNADIHTVLRTLADYSGKNIIASREVEGEVSARLYDTPWEDALNSILKAHGYGAVEEAGIIRVGVLQKLRSEELEAAAAERKREDLLPIETQVVKLQFADGEELKPALQDMLSQRGKLQVDARTNALIISDIPDYVTKIATMSKDLDSRTPQVEIVSKLVDVSLDNSKDLGIRWDAINIQPSGSPVLGSASVDAANATPVGRLRLGTVQSWGQLDVALDMLEKDKKANVVSNPNITTVNNREAKILVGAKIPLIVADQAGNAITQLTKIGIQMSVVPHVNSDRTITMDLHSEVSELSSQATVQGGVIIQTSEADTRVLVENGDTAIIGGLVRNVETTTKTGVPLLQHFPLIGWLFRNSNTVDAKRELIIFVTPRLIEAGMKPLGPQGTQKQER